ncbi:MAG: HAD family phosphatase [Nanoarchaeota archaeon]|nr:HAD family phosphatase [Nanoarchaeota archaeon]
MIKLIIFDMSGVFSNAEDPPFVKKFAEEHGFDQVKFEKDYNRFVARAEVDEFDGDEAWQRLLDKYGLEGEPEKIIKELIESKVFYKNSLEIIKIVKRKYKTAFLTNYNRKFWGYVKEKLDFDEYFDFGIVSYQIKARKPGPEGFKAIMDHFGVEPDETVFVDDSKGNVKKAAELGINAIHLKDMKDLARELERFNISF